MLEPLIPNNEGAYRPIRMKAPEGSLVNSTRPAPGNSRGRVGHMIVPVVFGALAKAVPDAVPAEAGSPAPRLNFFGPRDDGSEFQCLLITSGGLGASRERDGLAGKSFPTNTKMASLEVMESNAPLRFIRRELVPDSGGAGQHRGGLAQELVVQVLGTKNVYVSTSSERIKNPPIGYRGGRNGGPAALSKNGSEYLAPKGRSDAEARRNRDGAHTGRRRIRSAGPAQARGHRARSRGRLRHAATRLENGFSARRENATEARGPARGRSNDERGALPARRGRRRHVHRFRPGRGALGRARARNA